MKHKQVYDTKWKPKEASTGLAINIELQLNHQLITVYRLGLRETLKLNRAASDLIKKYQLWKSKGQVIGLLIRAPFASWLQWD